MEQKQNTGAIFKNNKKEKEIALWVRTSQKGMQYFSAAISEPYVAEEKHEPKKEVKNNGFNDLPF